MNNIALVRVISEFSWNYVYPILRNALLDLGRSIILHGPLAKHSLYLSSVRSNVSTAIISDFRYKIKFKFRLTDFVERVSRRPVYKIKHLWSLATPITGTD